MWSTRLFIRSTDHFLFSQHDFLYGDLLRLLSDSPSLPTDEVHVESKLQSCLSRNMAENTLASYGFLTKTKEQELVNETEDMQTDDFTKEDVQEKINSSNNSIGLLENH